MQVSLKRALLPISAATAMFALVSCNSSTPRRSAEKYMQDRPYAEYAELANGASDSEMQSRLDSLAYRDVFNGTQAANDSALVAEFNKIAQSVRGKKDGRYFQIENILKSPNLTVAQGVDLRDNNNYRTSYATQFYADKYAYENFFRKNGLFDKKTVDHFNAVTEQIKPNKDVEIIIEVEKHSNLTNKKK